MTNPWPLPPSFPHRETENQIIREKEIELESVENSGLRWECFYKNKYM